MKWIGWLSEVQAQTEKLISGWKYHAPKRVGGCGGGGYSRLSAL